MTAGGSIAFVLPWALKPSVGGVQRSTVQLARYLAAQGWDSHIVSLDGGAHQPTDSSITVHSPPVRDGRTPKDRTRFLARVIGSVGPSVLINQVALWPDLSEKIWSIRGQAGSKPQVISCFRNNPSQFRDNHKEIIRHKWRNHPWRLRLVSHPLGWKAALAWHRRTNAPLFRRALDQCDRFMMLSPTFVEELRWYVPDLDESKILSIPNGFDTGIPSTKIESADKKKHLLYVGRMHHGQKNVLLLPELWERLHERLPDWELHVVGDGPDQAEVEERFKKAGIPRWTIHGRQVPHEYFASARLFLMLSKYEGFGNTLIEAQMHGTVPVAFRSYSAIDWMLNDGEDALLIPPFDLDHYAQAVEALAHDEARWARMSDAARSNAERFSEERIGALWEAALEEMLAERPGASGARV